MSSSLVAIFLIGIAILAGCAQQDERKFTDRAEAEGRGANKAGQEALNEKAHEMEVDLANRQNFYGAIEGQYQGTTQVGDQTYNIKFTFARSVPPFSGQRIRQLSEIEADLNNLSFYIQVVQWHPDDLTSAVGCRVSQIRPDMQKGEMIIASSDCPNLYAVLLNDITSDNLRTARDKSKNLADKISNHEIQNIDSLVGTIQPSANANVFSFSVKKMN
ncbi:MAG TPA: hypothetical protein PLJ21_01370 [Pseudobdellovibrionaceae bacterium]|nr:hypothetical protein [Pseudobdellovibrionaceae bacterium]